MIVVEGLDAAGMLRQKGLTVREGAGRGLSDAALGESGDNCATSAPGTGAHWWRPTVSSLLEDVPGCGQVQDIGWSEHWSCEACKAEHRARRQRSDQPRPSGEPGRSWRPGEAWSRAQDRASPGSWRRHAKGRLGIRRAEQLREECSVSGLTNAHSAATVASTLTVDPAGAGHTRFPSTVLPSTTSRRTRPFTPCSW